jgi:hypothetical protein
MATAREIEAEAARPMAFFPHDSNASQDIKCRRLLRRLGMEGYGRWWRLCELLAATDGHRLSIETEEDAEIIAEELHLNDHSELMDYLCVLVDVGLVQMPGDGMIYSDRMLRNADYFGEKRANGKLGGRPRKTPVKTNH